MLDQISSPCADRSKYLHSEITEQIIAGFYETYNELGYGFLESVYEEALFRVLRQKELQVGRQVPVPVWFREEQIGQFFADLVVNDCVVIELKAVRVLEPAHEA